MTINLDGMWKLTFFASRGATDDPVPHVVDAVVPGNVELDLERAGVEVGR